MAIDILQSKVIGPHKLTWYLLIADPGDTKPTGEFPEGSGHYIANGSRLFQNQTQIRYEYNEGEWTSVGQEVRLPDVTTDDNGKVLSVVEGVWDKAYPESELPAVTSEDNGDVLTVVEGVWAKAVPSGGSKKYLYQINYNCRLSDGTNSYSIRFNATFVSELERLFSNLSKVTSTEFYNTLKLSGETGYVQVCNISNVTIAPFQSNIDFEPVSFIRINLANDTWYLQTSTQEVSITVPKTLPLGYTFNTTAAYSRTEL